MPKKIEEAREENKGNRNAMKVAINSEKSAEMKLVLTEAQFKSYEELQVQHANHKRKRYKKSRGKNKK